VTITLSGLTNGMDGTLGGDVNVTTSQDLLTSNSITSGHLVCTSLPGSYCLDQYAASKTCPISNYCPNRDMRIATECPQGAYCDSSGLLIYTNCTAGTFNNVSGSSDKTACLLCPSGSYCGPAAGQANPTECAAGKFNNISGSTSPIDCINCPLGEFCPQGSAYGDFCPPGTYNSIGNATSVDGCTPCLAGYYNEQSAQQSSAACQKCPVNHYAYDNSSTCVVCPGAGALQTVASDLATSPTSCLPAGWLNVMKDVNYIVLGSIVAFFILLVWYCIRLDHKHPGSSHLPIFFSVMSLLETGLLFYVISDLVHFWPRPYYKWTFPWTQGLLLSFSIIYGTSFFYNFFASFSWTKQVSVTVRLLCARTSVCIAA
jgi:hypothetical protein